MIKNLKKWLKRHILKPIKGALVRISITTGDLIDKILKRSELRVPPQALLKVRATNFKIVGQEFTTLFLEQCNLQANWRVLDVGCGAGRIARGLTGALSTEGEYQGFDIREDAIKWCQGHITPKHANFHFLHCDVYNKRYNPKGKVPAEAYSFPFEDGSFDLVFHISVLPHMRLAEVENYLLEMGRILKPGGTCVGTFFLYNNEVQESLHVEHPQLDFVRAGENHLVISGKYEGGIIALEEGHLAGLFESRGVKIKNITPGGSWSQRMNLLTAQAIVFATKE